MLRCRSSQECSLAGEAITTHLEQFPDTELSELSKVGGRAIVAASRGDWTASVTSPAAQVEVRSRVSSQSPTSHQERPAERSAKRDMSCMAYLTLGVASDPDSGRPPSPGLTEWTCWDSNPGPQPCRATALRCVDYPSHARSNYFSSTVPLDVEYTTV